MSLLTNQYFDIPSCEQGFSHLECGAPPTKNAKRRFFLNNGTWDDLVPGRMSARVYPGFLASQPAAANLTALMENGGREFESPELDDLDVVWDEV